MAKRFFFNLSLVAATVFSVNAGSIRGVVQDNATPRPNPVPGAVVTFTGMTGGGQAQYSDTTDQNGGYQIQNVGNGTYGVRVAKAGYTPDPDNEATVRISNQSQNAVVDLVLIPRPAGVTISGTVTDSLTNANLTGVKLLLQQRSMMNWSTIDSTVSAGTGAYTFDSVAAGMYRIQASLSGYATKTVAVTVASAQAQTVNIKLVPVQSGKLTGTVTADSAKGAPLSGATVILDRLSSMSAVPIDTVTTDANGVYLFAAVEAGLNYEITASKAGYMERSVRHTNQSAGIDTVNIALTKVATGSIYVKVMKQKDSALIAGATATVVRTSGGGTGASQTGNTAQNGIAAFVDLVTGTYNITVSADGFTPAVRSNYRLNANAKDTLVFYLTAAAGGTKTLTGTVTDSVSKVPLPNVYVTLRVQSTGGSLTLVDSTDASGKFVITGIPVLVYMGSVGATSTGYHNYSNTQVTLGQPGQADTARLNFVMRKLTAGADPVIAQSVSGRPEIGVSGANLVLRNFTGNGVISFFSPNGKLVYRADFMARAASFPLPKIMTRAAGIYVVSITQKNVIVRRQVVMQ